MQLSDSLGIAKDVTTELLGIRVEGIGTNPVATLLINLNGMAMPMRKNLIQTGMLSVVLCSAMPIVAQTAPWNGSYSTDGQCYCVGSLPGDVAQKIVPTPIGGQSVRQICDKIGAGPELALVDGSFNYSVYKDPQCGHGPFSSAAAKPDNASCAGSNDAAGDECAATGSKWDLVKAYSKPAQAQVVASAERATEAANSQAVVVSGPRYVAPLRQGDTVSEEVNESASAVPVEPESAKHVPAIKTAKKAVRKKAPRQIAETPEQIRARQQSQLAEARERLKLKEQAQSEVEAQVEATTEPSTAVEVAEQAAPIDTQTPAKEVVEQLSESASDSASESGPTLLSALRLPAATRSSSREFNYVQAQPISLDFGGSGVNLVGSTSSHDSVQYFLDVSMADTYNDVLLGMSYFVTPKLANRLTIVMSAGVEHGTFEFENSQVSTRHSDTGLFLGLSSRFVVNNQFEFHTGTTYSQFFEGDIRVFGAAYFHMTPRVDFITKLELGDNDLLGLGLRYYYQ